jgi:hypothetical protein
MLLSIMLEDGQASDDTIESDAIIELSDDIIADMQSMLEDDMDIMLSVLDDEDWASEGIVADARVPAASRRPAISISFLM